MKYSRVAVGSSIIGLLVLAQLTGCTAIGYGIGSAIDKHNQTYISELPCAMGYADKNKKIRITTDSATIYEGRLDGISKIDDNEYALRYAAFQPDFSIANTYWPILGDSVAIFLKSGDTQKGRITGFDQWFGAFPGQEDNIDTNDFDIDDCKQHQYGIIRRDSILTKVFIEDIDLIESIDGNTLGGDQLSNLAQAGRIPLSSTIMVKRSASKNSIPIDRVRRFEYMETSKAKWIGFGIGAAIDAVMIIVMLRTHSKVSHTGIRPFG
ncbi:MAG: hypothetical protein GY841_16935 [FCB group bacterium]|nr:hypothetical protein [FCB group bacterium]